MLITALRTNRRTLCHGFLWLILACPLLAQQLQPVTSQQADCGKFVQPAITTAGTFNSQNIDNRSAACDGFVVTYSPQGFATVSVTLQSANVTSTGAAGVFGTFGGTIATGYVNPATQTTCSTATSCEIRATGYFPYVRIQIATTGTGYLVAEFHGFKTNPNSGSGATSGGCVGTSTTPCVVDGPNATGVAPTKPPVFVAGRDFDDFPATVQPMNVDANGNIKLAPSLIIPLSVLDGSTSLPGINTGGNPGPAVVYNLPLNFTGTAWNNGFACTLRANITLTTSGLTRIITGTAAKKIRLCELSIAFASPVDVQVVEGTQMATACDTGASNMTGLFRQVVGFDPNLSSLNALTQATAADDLCISMGANVNGGGVAIYAVF